MEDKKKVYLAVFGIIIIFSIINGVIIYVLKNQSNFETDCPLPKNLIDRCECSYSSLGAKELRFCTCYPKGKVDVFDLGNLTIPNGTRGDNKSS